MKSFNDHMYDVSVFLLSLMCMFHSAYLIFDPGNSSETPSVAETGEGTSVDPPATEAASTPAAPSRYIYKFWNCY